MDHRFPLESRDLGCPVCLQLDLCGTGKSGALETQIPVAYEAHLWWLKVGSWISVRGSAEGGATGAAVLQPVSCPVSCEVK